MKKFKQLAALFLAFAMVLGVFSKPTVALAALTDTSLKASDVTIDYVNERLEVNTTATVYYAMKWAERTHATTQWEESFKDGSKQTIDFSNVSPAKSVTFYLTDDTDKAPIEIVVKAQETTLAVAFSGTAKTTEKSKIKVDADWTDLTDVMNAYTSTSDSPWPYGYLNVTVGKNTKTTKAKVMTATEAETYLQFKKGATGAWKSITELDVRKYTAYGAQLYFRIKPTNDTVNTTSDGAIENLGRASKEVKVTYAKQANAPKASITGDTKQIKLTKTQEYRTFTTTDGTRTYKAWVKVADQHMTGTKVNKVYLKDLVVATSGSAWSYNENNDGQGVQVRTAATDKAVASKVQTIVLNQASTPTATSGGSIEFKLVKNTTYDKGITVKNVTGPAIQVAVVSGSPIDVTDTKTVKWLTVAPSKTITIAGTALAKGDKIIYRTATIKDIAKTKTNEFVVASNYGTYNFRSELSLADQTFELKSATATATVTTASPSAVITGTSPYTVTVTNTASASAITVVIDVTTKNVANGTPTVVCVTSAADDASTGTASAVKLLSYGSFAEDKGKLKIAITAAAKAETKIFRVTLDGKKTYVTVDFKTTN